MSIGQGIPGKYPEKDTGILKFREKLRQVIATKESPHRVAVAFSIGVFLGMSPLIGIHTLLGLAIAWIFRLNKFVTLVGVFVTNPWTIVPIYTFGIWTGAKLLGINRVVPQIDWTHMTFLDIAQNFTPIILPFFVGTTLVGTVAGLISYIIIFFAMKGIREQGLNI